AKQRGSLFSLPRHESVRVFSNMKDASHSILWRRLDHPGHEAASLFFLVFSKKKNATHSIFWRRLDHPGHEAAWLFFNDDFWHLHGTAVFLHNNVACRLDYRI